MFEDQRSYDAILALLSRKISSHKQLQHSTNLAWFIT
jgi:hypothetical protein